MVKFIANNNKSASTKLFPFFVIKDLYPLISFDIREFSILVLVSAFLSKRL